MKALRGPGLIGIRAKLRKARTSRANAKLAFDEKTLRAMIASGAEAARKSVTAPHRVAIATAELQALKKRAMKNTWPITPLGEARNSEADDLRCARQADSKRRIASAIVELQAAETAAAGPVAHDAPAASEKEDVTPAATVIKWTAEGRSRYKREPCNKTSPEHTPREGNLTGLWLNATSAIAPPAMGDDVSPASPCHTVHSCHTDASDSDCELDIPAEPEPPHVPPATPAEVIPTELAAALDDLLDLHSSGIPVILPADYDAVTAKAAIIRHRDPGNAIRHALL